MTSTRFWPKTTVNDLSSKDPSPSLCSVSLNLASFNRENDISLCSHVYEKKSTVHNIDAKFSDDIKRSSQDLIWVFKEKSPRHQQKLNSMPRAVNWTLSINMCRTVTHIANKWGGVILLNFSVGKSFLCKMSLS